MKFQKRPIVGDIKILIIGQYNTGKTALVNRWIKNSFSETYKATISTDFQLKYFECNSKPYKIQIWDIGGMDRGPNFTKIFCKNSHGAIVVSDITIPDTLNKALNWKSSVDDITSFVDNSPLPMTIIQNKLDLIEEIELKQEYMQIDFLKDFSVKNKFCSFYQTSAKTGENIDIAVSKFLKIVIEKYERYLAQNDDAITVSLNLFNLRKPKQKNCC